VPLDTIRAYCKALRLPTVAQVVEDALLAAQHEDWPPETFLQHLLEQEVTGRRERRIVRLTKAAHFPPGKTLETFDQRRLPLRIRRQIPQLCRGDFISRAENILIFGMPGTGKTQPGNYPHRAASFPTRDCHRS
jgi:DNA replication protein DnaC